MTWLSEFERDHFNNHRLEPRLGCPWCRVERTEQRIEELEREVELLRSYGNKDCTAMADEALEVERATKGAKDAES